MLSINTDNSQQGSSGSEKERDETLYSTNAVLSDALNNLGKQAGDSQFAQLITSRILNNLAESLMPALIQNASKMQHLLGASDAKLSEEVLLMLQMEAVRPKREIEIIRKRTAANSEFFKMLDENGGLYKVGEVSDLTGLSRQAIANQRAKHKLIAIRNGHDFRFPGFQFKDGKKIPHLEDVLSQLPKEMSGVAKTSFFLTEIALPGGSVESPADALRAGKLSKVVLDYIINQAALFGRHVAK